MLRRARVVAAALALAVAPGAAAARGGWWSEAPRPPARSIEENLRIVGAPDREANPWDRWAALRDIGRHGTLQAAQILAPYLADARLDSAAADGLLFIRAPEAVPLLATSLARAGDHLRPTLCLALGQLGGDVAVDVLLRVARDDSRKFVRTAAIEALGPELHRRPSSRLVGGLLLLAGDPVLRDAALDALRSFDSREQVALLHAGLRAPDPKVREAVCDLLRQIGGPASTEPLIVLLGTEPDADVRGCALSALASVSTPEQLGPVVAVYRRFLMAAGGQDPRSAKGAVDALHRSLSQVPTPLPRPLAGELAAVVVPHLAAGDEGLRWSAAMLLGTLGHPSAAPALGQMIASETSPYPRRAAIKALAQVLDSPVDVRRLVQLATAGDDRSEAQEALALVRSPAAVEPLVAALKGEPFVRRAAVSALEAIGRREAVPALVAVALDDDDRQTREAAAAAVASLGDPAALPALAQGLKSSPPNALIDAFLLLDRTASGRLPSGDRVDGFPQTTALLRAGDEVAATVLNQWPRVLPTDEAVLVLATQSRNEWVRRAAVTPLSLVGTAPARAALCQLLRRDPDFGVRVEVAERLGREPTLEAVHCLAEVLPTLGPNDINVREKVENALREATGRSPDTAAGARRAPDWSVWREGTAGLAAGRPTKESLRPGGASISHVLAALGGENRALQLLTARAVEHWPDAEERRAAAVPIARLLTSKVHENRLRNALVLALGATGEQRAVPMLAGLLAEQAKDDVGNLAPPARALRALGDARGIDALLRALDTDRVDQRREACEALAAVTGERLHYDARRWLAWWRAGHGR